MKFPNMVYRCPGSHHCKGGSFDYASVRNEAELHQKLADGWFVTLPEAMGEKPAAPAPVVNEQPEDLGQQTASAPPAPQPAPLAPEQQVTQSKAGGKGGKGGKKQEPAAPAAPAPAEPITPPWGA